MCSLMRSVPITVQKGLSMSLITMLRGLNRKPYPASNPGEKRMRFWLALGCISSVFLLSALATRANDPEAAEPLRVLIVGGGPDLANNQVAIESNVRYVGRLLPA